MNEKDTKLPQQAEPAAHSPWRQRFFGIVNVSIGAAFLGLHFSQKRQQGIQESNNAYVGDVLFNSNGVPITPLSASDANDIIHGLQASELKRYPQTDMMTELQTQRSQVRKTQTKDVLFNIVPGAGFIALGLNDIVQSFRPVKAPPPAVGKMSQQVIESRANSGASMLR